MRSLSATEHQVAPSFVYFCETSHADTITLASLASISKNLHPSDDCSSYQWTYRPRKYTSQLITMNKNGPPPSYDQPPPTAPPSYFQSVGGVPPASPYTPAPTYAQGPAIVTTIVPLGSGPTHTICPHCRVEIETATKSEPGMIAYISGAVIALLGCFFGCCLIPCCIDECMDIHHTCPNCKAYLGKHAR